jgi:hypothetical protein
LYRAFGDCIAKQLAGSRNGFGHLSDEWIANTMIRVFDDKREAESAASDPDGVGYSEPANAITLARVEIHREKHRRQS